MDIKRQVVFPLLSVIVLAFLGYIILRAVQNSDFSSSEASPINSLSSNKMPTLEIAGDYDVVIIGGGVGGFAAAVQAARLGQSVLILEETGYLGGQNNPVPNMDGTQIPGSGTGIYAEFIARVQTAYGSRPISTCYWNSKSRCFEPKVGRQVMQDMLSEAGVTYELRTPVASVTKDGNRVTGVITGDGRTIRAGVVIDATEYADVIPMTGARYRVGNALSGEPITETACVQDITYAIPIRDYKTVMPVELKLTEKPPGYDAVVANFKTFVAKPGYNNGNFPFSFEWHNLYRGVPDSLGVPYSALTGVSTKTMVNLANDYPGFSVITDSSGKRIGKDFNGILSANYIEDRSLRRTETCQARLSSLNFLYYVQQELGYGTWSVANDEFILSADELAMCHDIVPSTFDSIVQHFPPLPYVREGRRIVPVKTLTGQDILRVQLTSKYPNLYRQQASNPSSLGIGDYGNDLHNCSDDKYLELELDRGQADFTTGGLFQVPMEVMIPETVDGFLVAGKSIGTSRVVNGSTRLQPIEMLIGQAVGTIASLAIKNDIEPRAVSAFDVQDVLLNNLSSAYDARSAISLFVYRDVATTHPLWKDVQLTSTWGVLSGYGDYDAKGLSTFGISYALTRGQTAAGIVRLFDLPISEPATATFEDVPKTHLFFKFVETLYAQGITSGCSSSPRLYCPNNNITRGELAVFLARAGKLDTSSAPATPTFVDVPKTHQFYNFVEAINKAGWMIACTPGKFCVNDKVLRGDMATVVTRVLRSRN